MNFLWSLIHPDIVYVAALVENAKDIDDAFVSVRDVKNAVVVYRH